MKLFNVVTSGCIQARQASFKVVVILGIFSLGSMARADLVATETLGNFGTVSQLNSGVTGTDALRANSCVPTSVDNGLIYLNTTYGVPGLIAGNGDTYLTENTLSTDMGTTANGTTFPNEVSGLATYIGPTGQNVSPPVQIVGGQISPINGPWGTVNGNNIQNNTLPTVMQMYNWLLAKDAVEFWINWSGGGAHSVTLYGIDINTVNGVATGSGTLSFIDPFGGTPMAGGNGGSAVTITSATFTTIVGGGNNGEIMINGGYTGGAANNGADPDNAGRSSTGYIVTDLAEGIAVPEPSTCVAGALLLVPIAFASLRKLRVRSLAA
jgi:hypothetical protein